MSMRKVTAEVCGAFVDGRSARRHNCWTNGKELFLHNNKIMWKDEKGVIHFSLCGWNTRTTRDRLNGAFSILNLPYRIHNHEFEPYIGDEEISSRLPYSIHDFLS